MRPLKRPPTLRTFTQIPLGKREFQYANLQKSDVKGGPGPAPPGFGGPTVSYTEWMVYWALWKVMASAGDVRKSGPPFIGFPPDWTYQQPFIGGRAEPGGAIVDFIVWRTQTGRPTGFRVQTEYYHLFTSYDKQVSDLLQKQKLADQIDVVDLYDYLFTGDATGQLVIQTVKSALGLIETPDPLRGATAQRNPRRR
jgi:hypothetical protein